MSTKNRREVLGSLGSAAAAGLLHPALRTALPAVLAASEVYAASTPASDRGAITPVPFSEVILTDDFWAPRFVTQQDTLVPFAFGKVEPAIENLRRTAAHQHGETTHLLPLPRYVSSDLYKVMEGAAYLLKVRRDPTLEAHMDAIIKIIAAAQSPDGYLYEDHIVGLPPGQEMWGPSGTGDKPYSWEVHSHELYCMGHMYEAAIAYYEATGKDAWLKVAEKSAQHINRVFFMGDPAYNGGKPVNQASGHEEIELALTKLYRVTGDRLYLDMAKRFLDIRGITFVPHGEGVMAPTYAQQQAPVALQRTAVGHAVRAAYLYSGMAEVATLDKTHEYDAALDAIWHDIVDRKMHITGGLGAVHGIEGFGADYDLPNARAYNETCAAVANVMFNMRMFRMSGDAAYLDVAEVALFNNVLAGTNLAGNRFFYVNPLASDGVTPFNNGTAGRVEWFDTACCPSNLARLIPQVPGLMYSVQDDTLFVTLYGSNRASLPLAAGKVAVEQHSRYPFDGTIDLTLTPSKPQRIRLKLRIPTWALGRQFVPGTLYRFADGAPQASWTASVNGRPVHAKVEKGFAVIDREWHTGDRVSLKLPLQARLAVADLAVEADRGRVAVTRGPIVYCAEAVDNPRALDGYRISLEEAGHVERPSDGGPLAAMPRISIGARLGADNTARDEQKLTLIPYFAWNNRGAGAMAVWMKQA